MSTIARRVLLTLASPNPWTRRTRRTAALAALTGAVVAGAGVVVLSPPASAAQLPCTTKWLYEYTGQQDCFLVPWGLKSATFDVHGAQGGNGVGNGKGAAGGLGGHVRATIPLTPGGGMIISVGGQGEDGSKGVLSDVDVQGWGAKGGWDADVRGGMGGAGMVLNGNGAGGAGGGASDVRGMSNRLDDRWIVAGGGGGGGGHTTGADTPGAGGAGGGLVAADGGRNRLTGGDGYVTAGVGPGKGGTQTAGGAGETFSPQYGKNPSYDFGNPSGTFGNGGNAYGIHTDNGGSGGGGGGGWYGGSSSGTNSLGFDGGGGGGGSDHWTGSATGVASFPGTRSGNGEVAISLAPDWVDAVVPSTVDQLAPYTLSADISGNVSYGGGAAAGGSVQFVIDGRVLPDRCNGSYPVRDGIASCTILPDRPLNAGTHTLVVRYSGFETTSPDAPGLTPADSAPTTFTVGGRGSLQLASSAPSSVTGQPVTLTATASAEGSPAAAVRPSAPITFFVDGTAIGTVTPHPVSDDPAHLFYDPQVYSHSSQAQLTTTALTAGTHRITASYAAGSAATGASAPPVAQTVTAGTWAPGPVAPVAARTQVGGPRVLNDDDNSFVYTGSSWFVSGRRGQGDANDDLHATGTPGQYATLTFTGTGAVVTGETFVDQAPVDVYLDGVLKGRVNRSTSTRLVRQEIYRVGGLPAGQHTIRIVHAGTTGQDLTIDAATVYSGQNLVLNGGFEQPALAANSLTVTPSVPGWTEANGGQIEVDSFPDSAEGSQYNEIDANGASTIRSAFPTKIGHTYAVSFRYSARAGYGLAENSIGISVNGQSVGTRSADGTGQTGNVWKTYTRTFTATGATGSVAISENGPSNNIGMRIDDVEAVDLTP